MTWQSFIRTCQFGLARSLHLTPHLLKLVHKHTGYKVCQVLLVGGREEKGVERSLKSWRVGGMGPEGNGASREV